MFSIEKVEPLTFVIQIATILTLLSFLSGIQICLSIRSKGSTADFSAFPFIAGTMSTCLWLIYGLLKNDLTLVNINSFGLFLFTCYTLFFYFHTHNKRSIIAKIALLVIILSTVVMGTSLVDDPLYFSGLTASIFGLMFVASPLASLKDVISSKSVESLPFLLILSSFLVSTSWLFYGMLTGDAFIQIPNAMGSIISGFQLVLFLIFPSTKANFKDPLSHKPLKTSEQKEYNMEL